MSGEEAPPEKAKRQTQQFKRSGSKSVLSPDQKRRQAAVTDKAWRFFGSGTGMIAFLNEQHAELGGRPLDLAVNSEEGLHAVLAVLDPASKPLGSGQ
ncbi:antitoxin Xre/MbcA/ParS toxin-binding domain-containing protein [Sphingomonas aerophila]|uniref:Uncharacterized protein (DUF2384 family) n=1 Tax=Sphingomonas aerophila TaxID=1344948 RepID=A0A7W9ETL6_9SPHN|nr:antitoxin Xre/MbcA/ParS toxin-binding domain-containing protein [Sphingomonas aerophila]MBB5714334.1 uncharacterized protein (DUF2384 family) [Sphingomonas aerophila]